MQQTLFISDLHLDARHSQTTAQFLAFLQSCRPGLDTLYILGDLFEVWIGDDDHSPFHSDIIQALATATQKGLVIYLMHGNRDFLIGKKFLRATGCQLLADEYVVNLYGTRVLLMHGDTLCTRDVAYLKFRKKTRNFLVKKLLLLKSLKKRRAIADNYRAASLAHTRSTPLDIMDVTQAEVERVMQKHHVDFLIHGHTHRPDIHSFPLNKNTGTRMVLGAWHDKGNVLVWDEKGRKELRAL